MNQNRYSDENLQNHELNYWINNFDVNKTLHHEKFYNDFFNFKELKNKKVIEVGCGGCPITEYTDMKDPITIVEPLLDKLDKHDKFKYLNIHEKHSISLFDFNKTGYDYLICLNVIDHFNDPEFLFIDKFSEILNKDGELWLYYDVRTKNDADHLAIESEKLLLKLNNFFEIKRKDLNINPVHKNWSSVEYSVRLIAIKK